MSVTSIRNDIPCALNVIGIVRALLPMGAVRGRPITTELAVKSASFAICLANSSLKRFDLKSAFAASKVARACWGVCSTCSSVKTKKRLDLPTRVPPMENSRS
jgi:hypothetical protein